MIYYQSAPGFLNYANKEFNMGWELAYATDVRSKWLRANPDMVLWALWTAFDKEVGQVVGPNKYKRHATARHRIYNVNTLAGREQTAVGLNAALAYPDQGSGADIMTKVLRVLRTEEPLVYSTIVNTVHDEFLWEVPLDLVKMVEIVGKVVMERVGGELTQPYGVPMVADVETGNSWQKG
jgi:DNA polymerase I-like protein with 3'-5' exonuclease and polymerase domains